MTEAITDSLAAPSRPGYLRAESVFADSGPGYVSKVSYLAHRRVRARNGKSKAPPASGHLFPLGSDDG